MRRSLVIYDLAPDPSEFPNIWGKCYFRFISVVYPLNNIAYCWPIFLSVMLARERYLAVCYPNHHTLIKKKIKFSSYIRKFRMEQLQSHIWLTASSYMGKYLRVSSYIRKALPHILLCNCSTEFPYTVYEENLIFFFISVGWWAAHTAAVPGVLLVYALPADLFSTVLKGTVSRDFLLQVFFMNRLSPSPWK